MFNKLQRYSIRKLTIGVASVLIGITFVGVNADIAHADTETTLNQKDTNEDKKSVVTTDDKKEDASTEQASSTVSEQKETQDKNQNTQQNNNESKTAGVNDKSVQSEQKNQEKQAGQQDIAKKTAAVDKNADKQASASTDVKKASEDTSSTDLTNGTKGASQDKKSETKADLSTTDTLQKQGNVTGVNAKDQAGKTTDLKVKDLKTDDKKSAADIAKLFDMSLRSADSNYNVDEWNYTNNDDGSGITITGYKGAHTRDYYIPNAVAFRDAGKITASQGVSITYDAMHSLVTSGATSITVERADKKADMVKAIGGNYQMLSPSIICSNSWSGAFANSGLHSVDLTGLNVSTVDDMAGMFSYDEVLTTLTGLDTWDTSQVRSTTNMFSNDLNLTTIEGIENWNFALNTDISYMFYRDQTLRNIGDMSNWNTSNVTNMDKMVSLDPVLTSIGDIHSWNVSNVKNMSYMFSQSGIKKLDISGWHFNDGMAQLSTDTMGETSLGTANMFSYMVNPATITANNLVNVPNTFTAQDFYGTLPLIVISNNSTLQAMNSQSDGKGGKGHVANTVSFVQKSNHEEEAGTQQQDFVFASTDALQKALDNITTNKNLVNTTNPVKSSVSGKSFVDLVNESDNKNQSAKWLDGGSPIRAHDVYDGDYGKVAGEYTVDLTKDVTGTTEDKQTPIERTFKIVEKEPDGTEKPVLWVDTTQYKQAIKDLISGDITYGKYRDPSGSGNDTVNKYKWVHGDLNNANSSDKTDGISSAVDDFAGYTTKLPTDLPTGHDQPLHFTWDATNKKYNLDIFWGHGDTATFPASKTWYITYTANPQTADIKFVDDDNNGAQVGTLIPEDGTTDETKTLTVDMPTNYDLASGQPDFTVQNGKVSTSYKFTAASDQMITIHLVHKKVKVDPNKPTSNPKPTDNNWFKDNNLTKDVTRTIKYSGLTNAQLGQIPDSQKSQVVHFTRTAEYDLVDQKIISGSEGNWQVKGTTDEKGQFDSFDLHTFAGYTPTIDNQVVSSVPAVTDVTADTADPTVNVTYIKDEGTNTISHAEVDKTYTGDAATIPTNISHDITKGNDLLTWPTGAERITLDANDFSFADTNGKVLSSAPVNVGTYHVVLNDTGLNKFKSLDSNFTWKYDPKTSYVVYKISKSTPNVTFQGTGSKIYDGTALSSSDYSTAIGLKITDTTNAGNDPITLVAGTDYDWTKGSSTYTSAPTEAGTYTIELTNAGKTKIHSATANSDNLDWTNAVISGSGTYTINKAKATINLSGSQTKDYNGTAATIDATKFTPSVATNNEVTWSIPSATTFDSSDFIFTDARGNEIASPSELGTYHVYLSASGLNKIKTDTTNYDWLDSTLGTYTIQKNSDGTVTLANVSDGQSETYKGSAYGDTDIDVADYKLTLPTGFTYSLQAGDLEFVSGTNATM